MSVSIIERVFLPELNLRLVHLPYKSPREMWRDGTYEFRLNDEILMSFPWEFLGDEVPVERRVCWMSSAAPRLSVSKSLGRWGTRRSGWGRSLNVFEHLVYAYRDCPRELLLEPIEAEYDPWGIVDILRAADRRLSFKRLTLHALMMDDGREPARRILYERFRDRRGRFA